MRGLHINWTAPYFWRQRHAATGKRRRRYELDDVHLLTTVLSALSWRRFHGPLWLYTDRAGADCYERLGLIDLYRRVDDQVLAAIDPRSIDPDVYFAAGKLFAYQAAPLPFVQVDTDLVLRRPLPALEKTDVLFAHWEVGSRRVYPGRNSVPRPPGFGFPRDWKWSMHVMNCAILGLADETHRRSYTDLAIRYMTDNPPPATMDSVVPMVFAEQRILAMESERLGVRYRPVVSPRWVSRNGTWVRGDRAWSSRSPVVENAFHHTWLLKYGPLEDPAMRRRYCLALIAWVAHEYPRELNRLARIPQLGQLMSEWQAVERAGRKKKGRDAIAVFLSTL
jgi:hypothetical protein